MQQQSLSVVSKNEVAQAPAVDTNYKIGVGDILKIVVAKNELLSLAGVRVGNDGTIRLPMLADDVPAVCLTETELSAAITQRYKKYLLNPQVYVAVTELNSNSVALLGAVITPGRFQLQRPMRLLELLTYVNGPSNNAGRTVQIIRNLRSARCEERNLVKPETSEEQELINLPLAATMKGEESANPFVQAGDIIRVVEADVAYAFVIGSVKSGATINLKEPVTLSKALAMAGGVVPGAQIEKIKISRQEPGSLITKDFFINLKDLNKRNQEDILLQANDVVDVPGPNGTKKFLKDIFRTAIPAITRVPIYIP